jgi:hypothetical protein
LGDGDRVGTRKAFFETELKGVVPAFRFLSAVFRVLYIPVFGGALFIHRRHPL